LLLQRQGARFIGQPIFDRGARGSAVTAELNAIGAAAYLPDSKVGGGFVDQRDVLR
jgi:hypothetical protein